MNATVVAFLLYLGVMILVGILSYQKTKNASDFFLGGRSLGPWFTALSAEASDMSAWLLMGLPGLAYATGLQSAFWTAVGLVLGTYLNWLIVAKRIRHYTINAGNSITIPEFLTNRFHDKTNVLNIISSLFILFFFIFYTASGFSACAKLFVSVFNISYGSALLLGVFVILLYTLLGGFFAVCSTDFIQGSIMFVALVFTAIFGIAALGGVKDAFQSVAAFGEEFVNPFVAPEGQSISAKEIISSIGWGLGYFGMPHILVRFMAIRSSEEVKLSRRIAMFWVIIAMAAALIVGIIGKAYLNNSLSDALREQVFIESLKGLFPAFIAGIFLCSIFAASMSTADSQLLVAASAFSKDVYKPLIRKKASDNEMLIVSRITVLVVALIAIFIASDENSKIFDIVEYAWAGFGAVFGPIILCSLFWRKTTKLGALLGMVVGGVVMIIWANLSGGPGGIFDLYELVPGFVAGLIAIFLGSIFDKSDNKEVFAEYDKISASYKQQIK